VTELICIRFRRWRREFVLNPEGLELEPEDWCFVEGERGGELGQVCGRIGLADEDIASLGACRRLLRRAGEEDLRRREQREDRERHAFKICRDQIEFRELPMKLVDVELEGPGGRLTFYFTSEGRVDFRELVKDLAAVFRTRIELRQIGVRDDARRQPVLGACGQQACCSRILRDSDPVTLKMAKDQRLPLTPSKLLGVCARLKCCLTYELEFYEKMRHRLPRVGSRLSSPQGPGKVLQVHPFREEVEMLLDDGRRITLSLDALPARGLRRKGSH